jgi:hyperosmotically inducible protein
MRKNITTLFGPLLAVGLLIRCAESDAGITTSVKTRLAADDTVKAYQIDVDTKDRVVSLSGTVATQAAKDQAVKVAHETSGVVSVMDNLTINATVPTTGVGEAAARAGAVLGDARITSAVKTKLLADANVGGLKIDVDTKDNIVTLTGTVRSETERTQALKLARDTDGVKHVVDRLTLRP